MFRAFKSVAILLSFVLNPAFAHEEPAAEEDPGPWAGKVAFGYLSTSGNTENTNLNGNFKISYSSEPWLHTFSAYAIGAEESGTTTAEAYGANWKTDRILGGGPNYLFGQLDYRDDRFSGYPTQFSQTIGYGRQLIDTGVHNLKAELGAGARQAERADGVDENGFVVRGALAYIWKFSETANFTQDIVIEYGDDNTYLESVSAVTAKLIGNLNLVGSFTVKNNSDVLPGIDDTDTYTALLLEYSF